MIALAPELGVSLAVKEYFEARSELGSVKQRWPELRIGLVHAFYANMGGFALELINAPEKREATDFPTRSLWSQSLAAPPSPKTGENEVSESVTISRAGPSDSLPNHARTNETAQVSSSDLEKSSSPHATDPVPQDLIMIAFYDFGEFLSSSQTFH